jgi:hypothetical protein
MSATIALGLSMFATVVFEKPLAIDLCTVKGFPEAIICE